MLGAAKPVKCINKKNWSCVGMNEYTNKSNTLSMDTNNINNNNNNKYTKVMVRVYVSFLIVTYLWYYDSRRRPSKVMRAFHMRVHMRQLKRVFIVERKKRFWLHYKS